MYSKELKIIKNIIKDQKTALSKLEKTIDNSIVKAVNLLFKIKAK